MLYDRYVDAVYAAASRLTSDRQIAEEVVQETFLALWNRAELFDPAIGLAGRVAAHDRPEPDGRPAASGGPAAEPRSRSRRRAARTSRPAAALDRLVAAGTVIGGGGVGPGPEGELAATELRQVLRDALGGPARRPSGRRSSWPTARS